MRNNKTNNNNWTVENIPDLSGKVIIVTGANCGIGFESSKEFARKCAHTILACHNLEKGEAALAEIKNEIPNASAEVIQLDLSSLSSVHQFAAGFKSKYDRLDILVNNAGVMYVPSGKTEDGFERHFGINHLPAACHRGSVSGEALPRGRKRPEEDPGVHPLPDRGALPDPGDDLDEVPERPGFHIPEIHGLFPGNDLSIYDRPRWIAGSDRP